MGGPQIPNQKEQVLRCLATLEPPFLWLWTVFAAFASLHTFVPSSSHLHLYVVPICPLLSLSTCNTTSHHSLVPATLADMSSSLGFTPIVKVSMADTPSKNRAPSLSERVAALDIENGGSAIPARSESPTSMARVPSNPILSPLSPTVPVTGAGGASPFGSLGGVKDDGTNIGGAAARKASIHERKSFTTTEVRGSQSGSRRPSRRGSGVVVTPGGQQAVFHTRTNVSKLKWDSIGLRG